MITLLGIRVVELTTDVAGPYTGMIFADFGAEVIKVENPETNPDRNLPTFRAAKFVAYNRNKKSIVIDLQSGEGKELMLKLLESSDMFLENLDPGIVDALGLSYETVSKRNPKIIYVSIKGYLPGPYGNWPALDPCIESLSGLTSSTGEPEPKLPLEGHPPLLLAQPSIPCSSAIYAAIGAIGALLNRRKTGNGDKITVGMLETGASLIEEHLSAFALYGTLGKHALNLRKTKDGWALVSTGRWDQFCKTFDVNKEFAQEFATREAREMKAQRLEKIVDDIISKMSSNEVRERLAKFGMDGAALGTISDLVNNEHLKAIKNFVPLTPDSKVSLTSDRRTAMCAMLPIRASDYNSDITANWNPAPKLGEHTLEVLRGLGYGEEKIKDLQGKKII